MCANEANGVAVEEASLDKQELASAAMQAAVDWIHTNRAALDVYFVGHSPEGVGEIHFKGGIETMRRYLAGQHVEVTESLEVISYQATIDGVRFMANSNRRRQVFEPAKFTIVL
jgi:hypothetical protein